MLVAVVDTSGYSSAIASRYQAYLLTETPLTFAGRLLHPGAYGFGFIAPDTFVVMDIGGHEQLTSATIVDPSLRRPNPLQIREDAGNPKTYRLYMGRSYVSFRKAAP